MWDETQNQNINQDVWQILKENATYIVMRGNASHNSICFRQSIKYYSAGCLRIIVYPLRLMEYLIWLSDSRLLDGREADQYYEGFAALY